MTGCWQPDGNGLAPPQEQGACGEAEHWVPSDASTSVACNAVACMMVACWPWEYGNWNQAGGDTAPVCGG